MSVVGDNIARATAAGIRAARLAPLVHCAPGIRDIIRDQLAVNGSEQSLRVRAELDERWAALDAAALRGTRRRL